MQPHELVVIIAAILFGGWIALRLRRWRAARKLKRRFAIGARAEKEAISLLQEHGYTVLNGQVTAESRLWVDGEEETCTVRADLIVARRGKRYVVEVKSGKSAPDPRSSATRRQLLEYEHAFSTDGLLLADMDQRVVKHVTFRLQRSRPRGSLATGIVAIVAATVGWLLGRAL